MKFELQPYNRNVPDAELLADLRAVANKLSVHSLTQEQYDRHGGRFSAATLKKRFGWNAALEAAGLKPTNYKNIDRDALIDDIKRVADVLASSKLTLAQYKKHGKYSTSIINRHFDDWRGAVRAAGLEHGANYAITNEELFDNMERVWRHLGRQPTSTEMNPPLSRYSHGTYSARFNGYRKALEAFVASVNEEPPVSTSEFRVLPNSGDGIHNY